MAKDKFKVVKMIRTCTACPSQWDGTTAGSNYLYFRYRWGYLSVDFEGDNIISERLGDDMDGWLTREQLEEKTKEWLDFSECTWENEDW